MCHAVAKARADAGPSSVALYKDKPVDPQAVRKDLGVESVLTGTVATDGSELLVNVVLNDSSSGSLLF